MATLNARNRFTEKTHEGAPAARINAEQQLRRSVMSCMLWEDGFYEDGQSIADRIVSTIPHVKAEVVRDIAIEAREQMKLRHVPLLLARTMAALPSHKHVVAETLARIIQRPDELTEYLAIYWKDGRCSVSNQSLKGLAEAFGKFNEYSLAKYNRKNAVKLRDVLRLCRPKPKDDEQSDLWKRLLTDELKTPDTWEVELSQSTDKLASWTRLLQERKLGALALLRNLRNMQQSGVAAGLIRDALRTADPSRVLPFRFIAAARYAPRFEPELESLLFRCCESLPKMKGITAALVDISPSMECDLSAKSDMQRIDAGCGLAMVLREVCEDARVFSFSNDIIEVPNRRGFALRDALLCSQQHNGTRLGHAVSFVNSRVTCDRLIVITDEQSQDVVPGPKGVGYMINVASNQNGVGYGPWTHLDGFSEAVISYISAIEDGITVEPILQEGDDVEG